MYFRVGRGREEREPGAGQACRGLRCRSAPPRTAANATGAATCRERTGPAGATSAATAHAGSAITAAPARLWAMPPWVKRYRRRGRPSKAREE